jgi:hypothetical protein
MAQSLEMLAQWLDVSATPGPPVIAGTARRGRCAAGGMSKKIPETL